MLSFEPWVGKVKTGIITGEFVVISSNNKLKKKKKTNNNNNDNNANKLLWGQRIWAPWLIPNNKPEGPAEEENVRG